MFPIFGLFVCSISNIVESQIEMENIFSLAKIVINLKSCRLQTFFFFFLKLIFLNKNYSRL